MTETNKPNDGEPIVKKVVDPVFGEKFIATPVFWRFLDELSNNAKSVDSELGNIDAVTIGLMARVSSIEETLAFNPFTIDSTGWTIDTTKLTIDMSKA